MRYPDPKEDQDRVLELSNVPANAYRDSAAQARGDSVDRPAEGALACRVRRGPATAITQPAVARDFLAGATAQQIVSELAFCHAPVLEQPGIHPRAIKRCCWFG